MILGLVAYCDDTGLGSQTQAYFDHLKPAKTMVLDRSGAKVDWPCYPERMPGATVIKGLPVFDEVDQFLDGLDMLLMAENAPTQHMIRRARELGVKTVVVPNYEYFHHLRKPHYAAPDLWLVPSLWHYTDYPDPKSYLPFPIQVEPVGKPVESVYNFVHIAGRPIFPDRNGTAALLAALRFITSDIKLTIFCQQPDYVNEMLPAKIPANVQLEVRGPAADVDELYAGQQVMIMPRRFGGLCLPVNEALGRGLPVIMPDIEPNNLWLPSDWLISAKKIDERMMGNLIDIYDVNPAELGSAIDIMTGSTWYAQAQAEVAKLQRYYSWTTLLPKYVETLSDMV